MPLLDGYRPTQDGDHSDFPLLTVAQSHIRPNIPCRLVTLRISHMCETWDPILDNMARIKVLQDGGLDAACLSYQDFESLKAALGIFV
jgi:hypothetical protein